MIEAYDLADPDPEKRKRASVQLIDEIFGPGLVDRLARLEGREEWLREVRRGAGPPHGLSKHRSDQVWPTESKEAWHTRMSCPRE